MLPGSIYVKVAISLAYAFTLAWRFNKELVFFTKCFNHTTVVFFFYCIVTTEEDHRRVVEMFGEKEKFFVEPPG